MTAAHCPSVLPHPIGNPEPPGRRGGQGTKMLFIMACLATSAAADVSGNFTYLDNGATVTITGYPKDAVGEVSIPSTILDPVTLQNDPVTGIGSRAFYNCPGLTKVTIPSGVASIGNEAFAYCGVLVTVLIPLSVTSIGGGAFANCFLLENAVVPGNVLRLENSLFYSCNALKTASISANVNFIGIRVFQYCSALTSISVDLDNPSFSSANGVLFDKPKSLLIAFPSGLGGGYIIPSTVTGIGSRAFFSCKKLEGVTFPASTTSIGQSAFSDSITLLFANFMGGAPSLGASAFSSVAPGFAVYYLDGGSGFPVPPESTWNGYPAVNMGVNETPGSSWLLSKGLPANTNLESDTNGDGVSLLMAHALNLNPYGNLSSNIPKPVFTANQMSLGFYAGTAGVAYAVECSSDMTHWSTDGVSLSAPDANQVRTATVPRSGPSCFMRLVVSE